MTCAGKLQNAISSTDPNESTTDNNHQHHVRKDGYQRGPTVGPRHSEGTTTRMAHILSKHRRHMSIQIFTCSPSISADTSPREIKHKHLWLRCTPSYQPRPFQGQSLKPNDVGQILDQPIPNRNFSARSINSLFLNHSVDAHNSSKMTMLMTCSTEDYTLNLSGLDHHRHKRRPLGEVMAITGVTITIVVEAAEEEDPQIITTTTQARQGHSLLSDLNLLPHSLQAHHIHRSLVWCVASNHVATVDT
ncbi:hypothetical protein BJ165DRAFT_699274 [Panaeolus papilionaceus]|nr:hypothetical protein BJ165DRAFT_699274 [Panaeolus papilionaceus]